MIDTPPRPSSSLLEQNENARIYIQSLLAHSPLARSDVGKWEQCCKLLGTIYEGNPENIAIVLKDLIASKSYPGLNELLADGQPLQGGEEKTLVPELPESAKLLTHFLPRPPDNPQDDWYTHWDSSHLAKISPWLANYLDYSNRKSPEGYVDFHISSALWVLSVVVARRIYVDLAEPIYTPIAFAMVARTSLFAKTVTAMAGVKVLKQAGLGWLLGDDETTPQKLLGDMSGKIPAHYEEMDDKQKTALERRLGMAGQRGWFYDEFNQLIDSMTRANSPMAEFAGLFRKLDDCHNEYRYSTRMHGQEIITNPYLVLLANTTPANLRKHAARNGEFWNDGFWARFAFNAPPQHAWKTRTMKRGEVLVSDLLTEPLKNLHTKLGEPFARIVEHADIKGKGTSKYYLDVEPLPQHAISFDENAYQAYVLYREALRELIAESSNHDLDGSYVRLSTLGLRIAALFAALENDNCITLTIWTLAQEITEMFRRNLHELYNQVTIGTIDDDPIREVLITYIKSLQGRAVTVREISQYGPLVIRKLRSKRIREELLELEKDGVIQVNKDGKKETYQLVK